MRIDRKLKFVLMRSAFYRGVGYRLLFEGSIQIANSLCDVLVHYQYIINIKLLSRRSFGNLAKSTFSAFTTDDGFKFSINLQGPVVQKPVDVNLRLKINKGVLFSTPKCCSRLIFGKTLH